MFFFLKKNKLYVKKILKKDSNINTDKTTIWILSLIIFERSLTGRKPPEEIIVKARFKESKVLIEKKLSIKNIDNVKAVYKRKIFVTCFNISELLKEIKFVKVFLKFSS